MTKKPLKDTSRIWKYIRNLFVVNDYVFDELFNLNTVKMTEKDRSRSSRDSKTTTSPGGFKSPKRAHSVKALNEMRAKQKSHEKTDPDKTPLTRDLGLNLERIKELFHLPKNKDVVIREFSIPLSDPVRAAIIYIDGAANTNLIDGFVLQPLMLLANMHHSDERAFLETVRNSLVPTNQVSEAADFREIINGVVNGDTVILLDNSESALVVETKGWPVRSISAPKTEQVTQGPHDSFNESFRQNLALVRKRVRTNALVTEYFKIGWRSQTDLALVYLHGVINPKIVREMRKRLKFIKIAYVTDTGIIQQFIGDSPYSLIPTSLSTERPDRVAAFLN